MLFFLLAIAWAVWPDLDRPSNVGGGENDAALVIGIEDYWAAPRIPGARRNARDWYTWFTVGRAIPAHRTRLLLDAEATAEEIRKQAQRLAADMDGEGTLWIVFIGHGAPDLKTGDASLLGVDVQPTAQSLGARGLTRQELLTVTEGASQRVLVLDSCFSGRDARGESLAPGLQFLVPTFSATERNTIELTAGTASQVAGALPRENRPAFSYLLLGALHGWGDLDGDGVVSSAEALTWTRQTLDTVLVGRDQTPQKVGQDRPLSSAGRTRPPNLSAIVDQRSESSRRTVTMPSRPEVAVDRPQGLGVDVEAEALYWRAIDATESDTVSPQDTAKAWCALANHNEGPYTDKAQEACREWTEYHEAQATMWTNYFNDYESTRQLLSIGRAPVEQKLQALDALIATYGDASPWTTAHLERARSRTAQGRRAPLPPFYSPPDWARKTTPRSGFFTGWDPAVRKHRWLAYKADGMAMFSDPIQGFGGVGAEIGYGPVHAGTSINFNFAQQTMLNVYGAVMPFAIRPSKRLTAEPRGSFLNPSVGLSYQYGIRDEGVSNTLEAELANHIWVSESFGLRLAGRYPFYGHEDAAPSVVLSILLNSNALKK